MNKQFLFGLMAFMLLGIASAYTVGDASCDGTTTTFPIDISTAIAYNNSPMNITIGENIYFEGYNDTEDWFPEGFWLGFKVSDIPFNISEYEYVSFDVDDVIWTQDQYSGYFTVALCNVTDEVEVCYRYVFNLDSMKNEFKGTGNRIVLTPLGCRYWNTSEPYYYYYDSDPCEYSELNFTEMRVYAWAEYGTMLPFSGTVGNFSFDTGENKLTSYDCADMVSILESSGLYGNLTSGWHLVDGVLDTNPTTVTGTYTGYIWESKKNSCKTGLSCSARLVGSDGYTAGIFYYEGGLNITGWNSLRDGYHNITARVFYDGTRLRYMKFDVNEDYGIANLPRVLLTDYTYISDYLPVEEGSIYLSVLTKVTVPSSWYPIYRYTGNVYSCATGIFNFDGSGYTYSYCSSLFDFIDSPVTYEEWVAGYAVRVYHSYGTNLSSAVSGKTIIGNALSLYAYQPSGYYINDNPTFSSFDIIGDDVCGSFETGYPVSAWNYSPDCDTGAVTGFMVAVTNTVIGLFAIVMLFGVLFTVSGNLGIDLGDFSSISVYLVVLAIASLVIFLIMYMGQLG